MWKRDSQRRLSNAGDLLVMLEHLCDGLAQRGGHNGDAPWRGIKLTLRQIRNIIVDIHQSLDQQDLPEEKSREIDISEKLALSSLAARIQKVPSGAGRIRELAPSSNGETAFDQERLEAEEL